MGELRNIPNVGKQTEKDLLDMGYTTIESLKGKSGEELYEEECRLKGCVVDRCQLYLYRAVSYFVNAKEPDEKKFKWWFWKDEFTEPSPCGAICAECGRFPDECSGCRKISGKVFWTKYMDWDCCAVYDCCVNQKHLHNCSSCKELPCKRFIKDPTVSDEENEAGLKRMLRNLKKASAENTPEGLEE